jgi:hypothetical protein
MSSRAAPSHANDLWMVFKGKLLSLEATALFPYTRTAQMTDQPHLKLHQNGDLA